MIKNKPHTKLLVDGGDPDETMKIRDLLGSIDGQTTNPSLIAKNPEIKRRIATGKKLTAEEEEKEYRKIVERISPLVGSAGVSIEVFSDLKTRAEQMLDQGKRMFTWIPNAYIKYPCTHEGLRAAKASVAQGIRVNMTLCFSQEQAAAVYAATKGSPEPVYVSPFIGRLDDIGVNGIDLIKNIKTMFENSNHHVHVLAASIRGMDHLLSSFKLNAELVTAPAKVFEEWATLGYPLAGEDSRPKDVVRQNKPLKPIQYKDLDINASWESFDMDHPLTTKGIQKFLEDYQSTLARPA